jgi:hypothetical protein
MPEWQNVWLPQLFSKDTLLECLQIRILDFAAMLASSASSPVTQLQDEHA